MSKQTKQQETIDKVIQWLKEEGYEPNETTHLRDDANYFAVVKVSEKKGFNLMFPSKKLDLVLIDEIIELDPQYQKAYVSLPALEQNRFFFDLKIALLEANVSFQLLKGVRDLKSVEVNKQIYFDGLSKDKFFDTVFTVGHTIEIAKVKLGHFRDSILPSQAGETMGDDLK